MNEAHVDEFESGGSSPPSGSRGERRYPSVACTRCKEPRWPYGGIAKTNPFICQRCTLVLSGALNVVDPCPERSQAQQAADRVAGARLTAFRAYRKTQCGALAVVPVSVVIPAPAPEPEPLPTNETPEPRRVSCRHHRPVWRLVCTACNPGYTGDDAVNPTEMAEWKKTEAAILRRDGRPCQHCGSRERLT